MQLSTGDWKNSEKAIAKPSLIHSHGHRCPVCTIRTTEKLLSKENPTDPGRSQANSPETPQAAVWKSGLQNQRNRNKLLKALWTKLPLKARLSPTINQTRHGFIWLNLENLQGPRFHHSSNKCISVLYCPPTEEILLMSSFNLPRWKQ